MTEPSASSSTTRRSSRAQRARSGEIHTRAARDVSTSPVRGHPRTSGSIPGRGSKRSSSTVADLIRSSRYERGASRSTSNECTYQPSCPGRGPPGPGGPAPGRGPEPLAQRGARFDPTEPVRARRIALHVKRVHVPPLLPVQGLVRLYPPRRELVLVLLVVLELEQPP